MDTLRTVSLSIIMAYPKKEIGFKTIKHNDIVLGSLSIIMAYPKKEIGFKTN